KSRHELAKNQKHALTWARTAELSGRGVPSRRQRSLSLSQSASPCFIALPALHLLAQARVHLLERDIADALLGHLFYPPNSDYKLLPCIRTIRRCRWPASCCLHSRSWLPAYATQAGSSASTWTACSRTGSPRRAWR